MAAVSHRRSSTSRSGRLLVVALLAPAVVLPLCVPLYAREDPELFGFPFFYWYQFAWVPATALLIWIVYRKVR